jgi:hypothetical protein
VSITICWLTGGVPTPISTRYNPNVWGKITADMMRPGGIVDGVVGMNIGGGGGVGGCDNAEVNMGLMKVMISMVRREKRDVIAVFLACESEHITPLFIIADT